MKYIYYILAVVILFTGLAVYGLFDTRVEVSEPVLSVNDRIFSKAELEALLKLDPSDMTRQQFIESLIEKQLLIQEGINQEINKEEGFRRSVQNFYEQSLIKILLDRKFDSLVVDVTTQEVARYEKLIKQKVALTKRIYPNQEDFEKKKNETLEKIQSEFINLSDQLKFIVLSLKPGTTSEQSKIRDGSVVTYQLDSVSPANLDPAVVEKMFDVKKVSLFIQDQKKEALVREWIAEIRESAEIWRK